MVLKKTNENALAYELCKSRKLAYQEQELKFWYRMRGSSDYLVDLLVGNIELIELKAVRGYTVFISRKT